MECDIVRHLTGHRVNFQGKLAFPIPVLLNLLLFFILLYILNVESLRMKWGNEVNRLNQLLYKSSIALMILENKNVNLF